MDLRRDDFLLHAHRRAGRHLDHAALTIRRVAQEPSRGGNVRGPGHRRQLLIPEGRAYAAPDPPAAGRRQSALARSNAWWMSGQNSRISASVVIDPTSQFDQNTRKSPPEPIIDRRNDDSARLPSTSASVNGASGMLTFLKT